MYCTVLKNAKNLTLLSSLAFTVFSAVGVLAEVCIVRGGSDPRAGIAGWDQAPPQTSLSADVQVKTLLDKMTAAGMAQPANLKEARAAYSHFYPTLSGAPENVFRMEDRHVPSRGGIIPIRIYAPSAEASLPIVVFFHGGGFVAGDLKTDDAPLRSVANRCACIVVSVAYRLAPEHKYPAAPDDAYDATKWVAEHAGELGADPNRIAVAGEGAGGNLAAGVTLRARERGGPHLIFQVLIYPTLDAYTTRPGWFADLPVVSRESANKVLAAYLPTVSDLRDPWVSPISANSLTALPAALIITDIDDGMRDQGEQYANRLRQDGVQVKVSQYPTMIHGFFMMAGHLDGAKKCIDETASALSGAFTIATQTAPLTAN
jgi:acetyl esterase